MSTIKPQDLKFGDLLLYNGRTWFDEQIKKFDGSNYSHSAIYFDNYVLEAIAEGVKKNTLKYSTTVPPQNYIHVYRFKKLGSELGDMSYPIGPVKSRISYFEQSGDRYAYEAILLLAVLCTTRRLNIPVFGLIIRFILDTALSFITRLTGLGKQPMICSELCYRCFAEASEDCKYALEILGYNSWKLKDQIDISDFDQTDFREMMSTEELIEINKKKNQFLEIYFQTKKVENLNEKLEKGLNTKCGLIIADFVTPRDLRDSPTLQFIGELETEFPIV